MRTRTIRKIGRILLRIVAATVVLVLIAGLAGLVVVQSGWFHEYVRQRIIAEIEKAIGGRVELGRFSFRGSTLTASIAPLVLHGKEAAGDPPLLSVESVTMRFRILSIAERKIDLASIQVEKPQLRVVIYPDGSDNFPGPGGGDWPRDFINIAIGRYDVSNGVVDLEERSVPVNLHGEGLALKLTYDPKTPAYLVELGSRGLRVVPPGVAPMQLGFSSKFSLEKTRLRIAALHLSTLESHADVKGDLQNPRSPRGVLNVQAAISVREAVSMFGLPLDRAGSVDFTGTFSLAFPHLSAFTLAGRVNARGVGYSNGRLHVAGAQGRAQVELKSDRLDATGIEMDALGAHYTGRATLADWRQVHVEGTLDGLSVTQAAGILTPRPVPWNGTLSGSFAADTTLGENDTQAQAKLSITPSAEGMPIEGVVDVSYNQHESELTIADSYVATPSTRLDASGALGRRMTVRFHSTDLRDALAAVPVLSGGAEPQLPMNLKYGSVTADGTVTGSLDDPRFRGQVSIDKGSLEGHGFDKLDANMDVAKESISASRFTLTRGAGSNATTATGTATLTAKQGAFEDAAVSAQFTLQNANLEALAQEAGSTMAVKGTVSGTIRVTGSVQEPQADLTVNVANAQGFGETLDRLSGTLKITKESLEVSNGQAADGPGRITFAGAYQPASTGSKTFAAADWKSGAIRLQLAASNLPVTRVEAFAALASGFDARVTADLRVQGKVSNDRLNLDSASGSLAAQTVSFRGQPLGDISLTAETRGEELSVTARGKVDAASFEGTGSWRLNAEQNGTANFRFSRLSLDDVHRLALIANAAPHAAEPDLPLEGFLDGGTIAATVALGHPRDFQASVTVGSLQFNPKAGQSLGLGVQPQDVALKNEGPLVVALTAREARIQPVRLTGRDTSLDISGTIPFSGTAAGADIAVRGTVNLSALQMVDSDLLARGSATVEASLRGALSDPSLNGRMDLKGASLYLKDVATGLDNVNGGVLFNRDRATIEKLTGDLGTGTLSMGGFVEFGTPLVYRLQATAQQVRLRLPIDLSTTFSANLALGGTSDASTLSGSLTLNRAAFNPHADVGDLLAAFGAPVSEVSPNDYLRGMQFDVRVVSSPAFELQTSLTRDIQSEVDLRLRGTAARPLLLGTVSVNTGQVQFFGNKYTIDRGDIRFTNPLKIEPVFDLALETKVSGVSVSVTFTGSMDKLRTNYSSDPPLESSKIIALLAVGRDPTQNSAAASAGTSGASANFVGAGGSLLSQALTAQLSSKLQRVLGASRIKIDPTMTGIDNTPQARLTFEQQVSKDVTMTYITNLNYTQEQIVRLQWDLTSKWSAIAVRDANGLFGIDFQYHKRFK